MKLNLTNAVNDGRKSVEPAWEHYSELLKEHRYTDGKCRSVLEETDEMADQILHMFIRTSMTFLMTEDTVISLLDAMNYAYESEKTNGYCEINYTAESGNGTKYRFQSAVKKNGNGLEVPEQRGMLLRTKNGNTEYYDVQKQRWASTKNCSIISEFENGTPGMRALYDTAAKEAEYPLYLMQSKKTTEIFENGRVLAGLYEKLDGLATFRVVVIETNDGDEMFPILRCSDPGITGMAIRERDGNPVLCRIVGGETGMFCESCEISEDDAVKLAEYAWDRSSRNGTVQIYPISKRVLYEVRTDASADDGILYYADEEETVTDEEERSLKKLKSMIVRETA